MSYRLSAVTLRTNNSPQGLAAVARLWEDIQSGRLPCSSTAPEPFAPASPPSPGTPITKAIPLEPTTSP